MQLTNKEGRMMTQSTEEVTDENHSAGMVGGHRKVLSGFLKLDCLGLNKRRTSNISFRFISSPKENIS